MHSFGYDFEANCLPTKTCDRMIGLKENCVHPVSNKPYIKASSGGADNSIEGIQVSKYLPREIRTKPSGLG